MAKFNVGGKVRFIEKYGQYSVGDVVEVTGIWNDADGIDFKGVYGSGGAYIRRFEIAEPKITKNQRITKLEEEVAELKLIVNKMRKPSTNVSDAVSEHAVTTIEFEGKQYQKVDRKAQESDVVVFLKGNNRLVTIGKHYKALSIKGELKFKDNEGDNIYIYNGISNGKLETVDVYELVKNEQTPKSPNQQRAEIIEKAKAFFENSKVELSPPHDGYGHVVKSAICDVEFIVNEENRIVVALLRWQFNKVTQAKGIAKCHPDNVFNEHIGKAISLGRALGIDVSEFEQAVQPNKVVVGSIARGINTGFIYNVTSFSINGLAEDEVQGIRTDNVNLTIINDTNAQYGGIE